MATQQQPFYSWINYSIVCSFVITTLSFELLLAKAMMITKIIIPPTTHIQGWTVNEEEVLVLVVVEETALSWATAIPVENSSKAIAIKDK
ncbi:MAG: hypothetical protein ACTHML_12925 [Ginsengibacter sp.]